MKELTDRELIERLDTEKTNMTRMRMNHVVSPLDNPMQLQYNRRLIAQLQTELRKRQLSEKAKSE